MTETIFPFPPFFAGGGGVKTGTAPPPGTDAGGITKSWALPTPTDDRNACGIRNRLHASHHSRSKARNPPSYPSRRAANPIIPLRDGKAPPHGAYIRPNRYRQGSVGEAHILEYRAEWPHDGLEQKDKAWRFHNRFRRGYPATISCDNWVQAPRQRCICTNSDPLPARSPSR